MQESSKVMKRKLARVKRMSAYDDDLDAAKARIIKQGPCAFCGDGYAAHRLIDAQMGRTSAGDSIESVADDYNTSVEAMVMTWIAYVDLLHDTAFCIGH